MYINRVDLICKIILILVLILMISHIYQLLNNPKDKQIYFNLSSDNMTQGYIGFNYHKHYFCVITEGKENRDIIETTIHELAHLLIETDEAHFMERYKNKKELK